MKRIRCYDKNKMNIKGEVYSRTDHEIFVTEDETNINIQRNIRILYNRDGTSLSASIEIKELR